MKEFSFLERLGENLLEGAFTDAFKPRLEPVQIAKALIRKMEQNRTVGPESPLVPNRYVARLHPDDAEVFIPYRQGLQRELSSHLRKHAAIRGFRSVGLISVELLPDPSVRRRRVQVSATTEDDADSSGTRSDPMSAESTMQLPRAQVAERDAARRPAAQLENTEGWSIQLVSDVTSLGRAVENDIVVDSATVSRHHAQITWEQGQFYLVDLESTNGSFVQGARVSKQVLSDGDEVSIGETKFVFRVPGGDVEGGVPDPGN